MKESVFIAFFSLFINLVTAQSSGYEDRFNASYEKADHYKYIQKDSAYKYLAETYTLSMAENDWANSFWMLALWNESSAYFYDLGTLKNNLDLMDSLTSNYRDEINNAPDSLDYRNALTYYNGLYDFELHSYLRSRKSFGKLITSIENIPDSLNTTYQMDLLRAAYSFVAKMYFNEGKYELAKEFYAKNIRFLKTKIPDDWESLFRNYSLLAEVYQKEGKYGQANEYFIKSFNFSLKNQTGTNSIITEAGHIINNYINLSRQDSANYYLALLKDQLPPNHPFQHKYHEAKAKILLNQDKPQEALTHLEAALTEIKEKWGYKKHAEVAMAYREIGDIYAKTKEFQKALKKYDLALGQLQTYNRTERLKILNHKAAVLNRLRQDTYLTETLNTVESGIAVLDTLKPGFSSQDDKLLLVEDAFPLFESGLEAAFAKYGATQDRSYLEKAFHFMEKSKSTLLLDALLNAKATQFAGIPQNLLEREQQLKAEIANSEKKSVLENENSTELQENLFGLKEAHRKLIHQFETHYPAYFDLRYDTGVIGLDQVQDEMKGGQMLLTYFYGNTHIYGLSITDNTIYFNQIKTDSSLVDRIKKWVSALADPESAPTFINSNGYKLYEKLLAPALRENDIEKITIIADGPLNYIPFSALNTNPKDPAPLLEKYTLSYASSATLLDKLKVKGNTENTVLAIAPGFSDPVPARYNGGHLLSALPNSKREIESIAAYFPEKSFSGSMATLENFRSYASAYSMIHLATHALVNNAVPEYSFLAFAPQRDRENLLYIRDLYDMKIPADLVTLSACETGVGKLQDGEGMISLSHAFFYSGAKSLINTLWNINDNSATAIMEDFYKNLSKGRSKDEALRNAKLGFITRHKEDKLSHPYYWSAFVVSGNTAPVVKNIRFWLIFALILLVLTAFGWFLYERRKRFREKHGRTGY